MSAPEAILRTVVSLPRFTVLDLVSICDLPAATVRTVLRRNEDWIEEVGTAETGKRGGRWKEYEPTAAAFAALSAQEALDPKHVPAAIRGVEELLLPPGVGRLSQTTAESLMYRARRFRREVPPPPSLNPWALVHLRIADALIALTNAEISGDGHRWRRLNDELEVLSSSLQHADPALDEALAERFATSRIAQERVTAAVAESEFLPQRERKSWYLLLMNEIVDLVSSYKAAQQNEQIFVLPTGTEIAMDSRRRVVAQTPNPFSPEERNIGHVAFVGGRDRAPRVVVGGELAQGNQLGVWNSAQCEANADGLGSP